MSDAWWIVDLILEKKNKIEQGQLRNENGPIYIAYEDNSGAE